MPSIAEDVTGYVLAGGRSTRMRRDKALLSITGMPLLEFALKRLRMVCNNAAILSGPTNVERDAALGCCARTVSDTDADHAGPFAGVCAALTDCVTEYALIMAVDQPNISADILHSLIDEAKQRQASGACFTVSSTPQPLPLVLERNLCTGAVNVFLSGERRLLPAVLTAAAAEKRMFLKIPFLGPVEAFENLNTPDDIDHWSARHGTSNQSSPNASD